MGIRVSTFQCSLRPGPAPLRVQQAQSHCGDPADQWVSVVRALLVGAEDGAGGFWLGLEVGVSQGVYQ